jgi:uncharacterized protein involved in exopolysaccharide biosynthesis
LRTELDSLNRRFTDAHPDVQGDQAEHRRLEEQRAQGARVDAQGSRGRERPAGTAIDRNPVSSRLRVSLADTEAQVASLRAKARVLRGAVRAASQRRASGAAGEAEYTQLNRDYEIQKKVYEVLLSRRQSATLGEGVQDFGGTAIPRDRSARVFAGPRASDRHHDDACRFAAALGAGLMAAFVASQLLGTFHDCASPARDHEAADPRHDHDAPVGGRQKAAPPIQHVVSLAVFASLLGAFVVAYAMSGVLARYVA